MLIVTMVTEDLDQAFHMKCHDLFSLKENKYSLILFHNDMWKMASKNVEMVLWLFQQMLDKHFKP